MRIIRGFSDRLRIGWARPQWPIRTDRSPTGGKELKKATRWHSTILCSGHRSETRNRHNDRGKFGTGNFHCRQLIKLKINHSNRYFAGKIAGHPTVQCTVFFSCLFQFETVHYFHYFPTVFFLLYELTIYGGVGKSWKSCCFGMKKATEKSHALRCEGVI